MKRAADLIGSFVLPAEMPGRMRLSIFRPAILCAALFFGGPAHSQTVPAMISFQGRLTDTLNNPLEGNHSLAFAVYGVPAGGTPVWTETHSAVPAVNGALLVRLGSVTPLPPEVFSGADAYLEITVDGAVLSPREHLITVPYAFNARLLEGSGAAAFVSTGAVNQAIGGVKTFTGNIDMNGTGRILNLAPPAAPSDSATKGYVDGAVQNSSVLLLATTQTFTGSNTFINQLNVSSDIYISAGNINLRGNIVTTPAGLLDAAKLENLVPNASIDGSSVTKQGNSFNGAGQLLRLDEAGRLPALDGSGLLNISSVAAGAVGDLQIGGGISQSRITGLVSDLGAHLARLDQLAIDTAALNGAAVHLAGAETITGAKTFASSQTITDPRGIYANRLALGGDIEISSEASPAQGAGVRVSTNVYIIGFASATRYFGDGSQLTGIGSQANAATTDTDQTISGVKTFAANVIMANSQLRFANFTGPPGAAAGAGAIYYNTGDNLLYYYNGSGWAALAAGGAGAWAGGGTGSVTLGTAGDKVGVGKTPAEKLDVAGNIKADYGLLAATAVISGAGAGALDVAGGVNAGSGNVDIIGADGRIPALSGTYIADMSGANLTNIPQGAITGLAGELLLRATDSLVVHLAGAETITGVKTFGANLLVNGNLGVGVAGASAKVEVKASDTQNYSLAIGTGTAYNFVVSTSGAVGVGAASPRAKMEVTGGANPGEYIMILNSGDKTAAWLRNK